MNSVIVSNMPAAKEKMINVRLTPAVHDQFKIACGLRGASMSSLLHQFIVRTIREERELEPRAFEPRQAKGVRSTTIQVGNTEQGKKRKLK